MSPLSFALGRPFAGRGLAYVYVVFSHNWHFLYVGQTFQIGGPLTRLGQHLGDKGTLRQCVLEWDGVAIEDVDDLRMVALPLPNEIGAVLEYRLGVEYLLQKRLHSVTWTPYFQLVSHVDAPSTTTLREIQETADRFLNLVEVYYL